MVDDARRWIDTANSRLRGGNIGVALELQGKQNWIHLRGTFPPKPNDRRTRPYSTKISLKMKACDRDSVARAELIAKEVGLDLNKGTFDWRKFSDFEAEPNSAIKTIDHWVDELERGWWLNKDISDASKRNTWRCGYQTPLNTLPRSGELTEEKLIDWITTHTKPCTRRRLHYTTCARRLAELANLPTETIVMLAKGYSAKPVNPRHLPSDDTIVQAWEAIQDPGWQHLFGLQATYGLRNHECFFADYSEFPVIRVRDESKTGTRPVKPLYPEWAERWGLSEPIYPKTLNLEDQTLEQLGAKITNFFGKKVGWAAYNLRHCYARRCADLDIPSAIAARLMGHTLVVHEQTYKAWCGEKVVLDAVDRALARRANQL
jgi:hypothetical protein